MSQINNNQIPKYVSHVTKTLQNAGFQAFIVGGCVRDLILGREPKDWDVTTNANPEQIQALFEKTVYENEFGTVGVCVTRENTPHPDPLHSNVEGKSSSASTLEKAGDEVAIVEVTPFRTEAKYSDFRHPDKVEFAETLEEDLKRRDFTINAMAYDVRDDVLYDYYKGQDDLKDMSVKAVGDPQARFNEDALRMLRAVRFAAQLGRFTISHETMEAIVGNSDLIKKVSSERIRDEFEKMIMSGEPMMAIGMLNKFGLLKHIIPELEEGIGCEQGGAHIFDVFEHLLQALGHATAKGWPLHIRLAALFHDIGKPRSRRVGLKKAYTFYGHEVIGARMTAKIMERLKFPKDITEDVVKLVRYHMFFSDTEQITLSAVRRTIVNIGRENIWDLMNIRECDRVGMKKKEAPYRLRKYHAMIEEALRAPTTVGMLKIHGGILMKELSIKPGPRMGWILHALLEECLEDPSTDSGQATKNNVEYLKSQALELDKLSDEELKELGEKGKEKKEEVEEEEIKKLRGKHGVE